MKLSKRHMFAVAVAIMVLALGLSAATSLALTADDDGHPVAALPASPFSGSLTDTTAVDPATNTPLVDFDDAFQLPLGYNECIEATMTPQSGEDFDLYVLSYRTATLDAAFTAGSGLISAYSENLASAPETITFVSDRSVVTTWYLDVGMNVLSDQTVDSGTYTVEYRKTQLPTPVVEATAPAVCAYGGSVLMTGTANVESPAGTGLRPMSGFTAMVMARPAGASSWTKVAQTTTTPSGSFAVRVKPSRTTQYYVKTQWAHDQDGALVGWGGSRSFTVAPKAYLVFATTPRSAHPGQAFTVSGSIKPSHSSVAGRHVMVTASKYNGSRYVYYKYYWMRSSKTAWSGRFSLPKGRWRLSLSAGADSLHASTRSGSYRYFTVR